MSECVRAQPLYLMLPGRRRVGAPEAPGSGQLYSTCQNGALQWVETALRACPALLARVGCGRLLTCY
jgi:hypothetical protein